jgi:hypothetical protein
MIRSNITFNYAGLISTPKELTGEYVKCTFYGPAGSGKTRVIGTFPEVLIIDTNKGTKTLQNNTNVKVISLVHTSTDDRGNEVNPNVYKTIIQILDDAKYKRGLFAEGEALSEIKTIAIDDMTDLCQFLKYGVSRFMNGKDPMKDKPDFDVWAILGNQLSEIAYKLKDLPYNVVVTAGDKLEKDENTGGLVGVMDIQGSFRSALPRVFDETYHFVVKSAMGKVKYLVETVNTYPYNSKTRVELPHLTEDVTYAKILLAQELKAKQKK